MLQKIAEDRKRLGTLPLKKYKARSELSDLRIKLILSAILVYVWHRVRTSADSVSHWKDYKMSLTTNAAISCPYCMEVNDIEVDPDNLI